MNLGPELETGPTNQVLYTSNLNTGNGAKFPDARRGKGEEVHPQMFPLLVYGPGGQSQKPHIQGAGGFPNTLAIRGRSRGWRGWRENGRSELRTSTGAEVPLDFGLTGGSAGVGDGNLLEVEEDKESA